MKAMWDEFDCCLFRGSMYQLWSSLDTLVVGFGRRKERLETGFTRCERSDMRLGTTAIDCVLNWYIGEEAAAT